MAAAIYRRKMKINVSMAYCAAQQTSRSALATRRAHSRRSQSPQAYLNNGSSGENNRQARISMAAPAVNLHENNQQ
jgi:hypothetical protein